MLSQKNFSHLFLYVWSAHCRKAWSSSCTDCNGPWRRSSSSVDAEFIHVKNGKWPQNPSEREAFQKQDFDLSTFWWPQNWSKLVLCPKCFINPSVTQTFASWQFCLLFYFVCFQFKLPGPPTHLMKALTVMGFTFIREREDMKISFCLFWFWVLWPLKEAAETTTCPQIPRPWTDKGGFLSLTSDNSFTWIHPIRV